MVGGGARQLARLAQRQNGVRRHRMPVGVIGPREATDEQMRVAEQLAHALATAGRTRRRRQAGRDGSRRARRACGRWLCDRAAAEDDATLANPYLSVALPTGSASRGTRWWRARRFA
jgi:hypothetical protein